jgi:type VI secretion system protein ImpA
VAVVNVESLLKPLTDEVPCGENLRWDRRYLEVERLAEGKEETQFSAAEEPDWREVRDGCVELFARGKHLRLAVLLTVAAVRLEGYTGLRDGLKLIQGLLDQYWDQIFPQLDAEDNNDPTERVNSLSALSVPLGTFGDKLKFIDRVQECALCESRQLGKFSMKDVAVAAGTLDIPETDGRPKPTLDMIQAAFEETDPEKLTETATAIDEAAAALQGIVAVFDDKCGSGIGPAPEDLQRMLRDAGIQVKRHMKSADGEAGLGNGDGEASGNGEGGFGGGRMGGSISGQVNSPDEAILALDMVCRYYAAKEPSSPVGLIVGCAKQMINKDFQQIVKVLTPDAVSTLVQISTPPES